MCVCVCVLKSVEFNVKFSLIVSANSEHVKHVVIDVNRETITHIHFFVG